MDRLDALKYFDDVAQSSSFSAVARKHSVAVSTVTLAITQLEKECKAKLLTRSTRKIALTFEGEQLLKVSRVILNEWEDVIDQINTKKKPSGPIQISATNDFGRAVLRPLLDQFQERYPEIKINLLLNDTIVDLVEEKIDIAFRNGPLIDSNFHSRLLIKGSRVVCASPAYWAKVGKPQVPADLKKHNCIILSKPGSPLSTWHFKKDQRRISIKVSGDRSVSDGEVIRQWALEGRGVVFKNIWDVQKDLDRGLLEVALQKFSSESFNLYAVYPNGQQPERVIHLLDFIKAKLQQS